MLLEVQQLQIEIRIMLFDPRKDPSLQLLHH